MKPTRVADLTVDELVTLLQDVIQDAVQQALRETVVPPPTSRRSPLNLPVVDVGPWPEGLTLRREELYGDDE